MCLSSIDLVAIAVNTRGEVTRVTHLENVVTEDLFGRMTCYRTRSFRRNTRTAAAVVTANTPT